MIATRIWAIRIPRFQYARGLRVTASGGAESPQRASRSWLEHWHWILAPVVVGMLIAPMVVTSRSYATDWANHLWLVWQQSLNIKELGHPSYFVQSDFGAFYPWFAFNGGTLYTVTGAVAELTGGHPLAAYVASYLVAFAGAYGGWLWLGRQLGLAGGRAHIPAILFTTSAYYVTNAYGRGDYAETIATSAVPLVVAGALHLLRAGRWTPLPLAAFIAGVVFMTGSHTITLLWAVTFLVALTIVVFVAVGQSWRPGLRRTLSTAAVGMASIGANAWFLAPVVAYHSRILINTNYPGISQTFYSKTSVLFGILRNAHNPPGITADVQAQTPTLAILWALVVGIALWPRVRGTARRMMIALTVLLGLLLWLILAPHVLGSLGLWKHVEFPFRLVTYATLSACGLVAIVLGAIARVRRPGRRLAEGSLVVLTLFSVVLALQQERHVPSFLLKNRGQVFASVTEPPPTWYYGPDYADQSRPLVTPTVRSLLGGRPPSRRAGVRLPASPFNTRYSYPVVISHPGTVATNVAAGPYLVAVHGGSPVGRSSVGRMIVRVDQGGARKLIFSTASSAVLVLGLGLTFLSLGGLLLLLIVVTARSRRLTRISAE